MCTQASVTVSVCHLAVCGGVGCRVQADRAELGKIRPRSPPTDLLCIDRVRQLKGVRQHAVLVLGHEAAHGDRRRVGEIDVREQRHNDCVVHARERVRLPHRLDHELGRVHQQSAGVARLEVGVATAVTSRD